MGFAVSEGAVASAYKTVIYGPEGVGKTTLARSFPGAVFIDTEGSTTPYAVRRITPPGGGIKPTSWQMLLDMVKAVRDGHIPDVGTLVLDTADWAETLCLRAVCAKHQKEGIEDFGYGKGYTYAEEEFGKLLNLLSEVVDKGIHVVVTAHAAMRRVELPEETGAYDHWEMKLEKKDAALVKEWADMILFCTYKTIVVKGSNPMEKNKAAGGKRVMYATHTPWWDGKNRYGLPDEMPLDISSIAHLFAVSSPPASQPSAPAPEHAGKAGPTASPEPPDSMSVPFYDSTEEPPEEFTKLPETGPGPAGGIPKTLSSLMEASGVTEAQVQAAVASRGYYPADMPIQDYDPSFIEGCLVARWADTVKPLIDALK